MFALLYVFNVVRIGDSNILSPRYCIPEGANEHDCGGEGHVVAVFELSEVLFQLLPGDCECRTFQLHLMTRGRNSG